MQKVIIMNDIWFWGILASITGIAIMISVIKHKKSVSTIKNGTYLIFSILMICLGITTILFNNSSLKFEIMAKQLYVASQRVL